MSKMKDTIITLYVDTAMVITFDPKKTGDEIWNYLIMGDNHNDPPKKEKFVSNVRKNSKLAWIGAVMDIMNNKEDFVIIKKIIPHQKKKNKSIIQILDSKKGAGTTHIDGFIKKAKYDDVEGYSIKFLVSSGGKEKTFRIDPKIRVI